MFIFFPLIEIDMDDGDSYGDDYSDDSLFDRLESCDRYPRSSETCYTSNKSLGMTTQTQIYCFIFEINLCIAQI